MRTFFAALSAVLLAGAVTAQPPDAVPAKTGDWKAVPVTLSARFLPVAAVGGWGAAVTRVAAESLAVPRIGIPKGEVPNDVGKNPKPPEFSLLNRTRFLSLVAVLVGTAAPAQPPLDPPPPPRDPNIPVITLPPIERVQMAVARIHAAGPDWGVLKLKAPEAWAKTKGKGIRVAVLDTGCDINHPDLKNRVRSTADVKDFTGSRSGPTDRQGHGTHCAGSVLADGPLPGVAPEADLIVGKVLDDSGSGGVDGIANGIRWAVTRNADVISMSLGGSGQDSYIPPALTEAEAAGVIIVVAAGNSGPREGTVDYPGGYKQSVAIGAVDANLRVASFSSRGPAVHTAGPGVNVRSTLPGGQYGTMSGTSMATPNVAGVAALWCAAHPEVAKKDRPVKFREAVKAASQDLGPAGRDTAYGWGFPDASVMVGGGGQDPAKPVALLAANPATTTPGGWSVLVWSAHNATSVTLDGQPVAAAGGLPVNPIATTTYTLVATNAAGSHTAQATVTVGTGPPLPSQPFEVVIPNNQRIGIDPVGRTVSVPGGWKLYGAAGDLDPKLVAEAMRAGKVDPFVILMDALAIWNAYRSGDFIAVAAAVAKLIADLKAARSVPPPQPMASPAMFAPVPAVAPQPLPAPRPLGPVRRLLPRR